jgi:NADH:ubiquinone oxidoreductase subunit H
MKMLDAELVLMLELLKLLLWCLFIVLLILGGWLGASFEFLTNEQDLTVLVVDVLGLDL